MDSAETTSSALCRNCGAEVRACFCESCGQKVHEHHGSLWSLLTELLSEWFALDGRLLSSLRALLRPGSLTIAYLEGKRVAFLAPLRLYLLASVLLFSSILNLEAPDAAGTNLKILGEQVISAPSVQRDGVQTSRLLEFLAEDTWLAKLLGGHLKDEVEALKLQPPQETMDALFDGLRRLLPTSLILFVPFLAAVLKLLYLRSGRLFVDHLVFAVHLQSALFLALTVAWSIANAAQLSLLISALIYACTGLALIVVYFPMAMQRVYRGHKGFTAIKAGVLLYCYMQLMGLVISLPAIAVLLRS